MAPLLDMWKVLVKRALGPEVKRDEEVWFVDGNIVLQAHGVAFRVYQDIFALNPEVFAGMFSVPQPATVETFDDCPVIHLSDNPNDLRLLLRVIFIDKEHVLYSRSSHGD